MCDDGKVCFANKISKKFARDFQAIRDHAERHGVDKVVVNTSDGRPVLLTFIAAEPTEEE